MIINFYVNDCDTDDDDDDDDDNSYIILWVNYRLVVY